MKQKGFRIIIASMTPGGMGGVVTDEAATAEIRKQEAAFSASIIGAEYRCLEERDGFVFDTVEARLKVIKLIREVNAGIVFTHLPFDYHSDHRAACAIVEAGTLLSTLNNIPLEESPVDRTPLLYHTSPLGFTDTLGNAVPDPTFFIDVTTVQDIKKEMLSCHGSQKKLMRNMFNMEDFFSEMRNADEKIGRMVGVPCAESYWQHLGAGFSDYPLIQERLKDYIKHI